MERAPVSKVPDGIAPHAVRSAAMSVDRVAADLLAYRWSARALRSSVFPTPLELPFGLRMFLMVAGTSSRPASHDSLRYPCATIHRPSNTIDRTCSRRRPDWKNPQAKPGWVVRYSPDPVGEKTPTNPGFERTAKYVCNRIRPPSDLTFQPPNPVGVTSVLKVIVSERPRRQTGTHAKLRSRSHRWRAAATFPEIKAAPNAFDDSPLTLGWIPLAGHVAANRRSSRLFEVSRKPDGTHDQETCRWVTWMRGETSSKLIVRSPTYPGIRCTHGNAQQKVLYLPNATSPQLERNAVTALPVSAGADRTNRPDCD